MNIFGRNIAYLRRNAGLTQKQLGKECFISQDCLSNIEIGIVKKRTIRHRMLSEYFGHDMEYLNSFLLEDIDKLKELAPNPICDKIEQKLIAYGHCIETKNKFTGEI